MKIKRGHPLTHSLRFKLLIIYSVTAFIPALIMIGIMPSFYQTIVKSQTYQLTQSTLSAVSSNIENYLEELDRLTLFPYYSEDAIYGLYLRSSGEYLESDAYNKLVADRAIRGLLRDVFQNTRDDIVSTVILPFDGSVFVSNSNGYMDIDEAFPFTEQNWYQKALAADGKAAFISPHPQNYMRDDRGKTVFSVSRLIKNPYSQIPIAVIITDADTRVFEDIVNRVNFSVSSKVMIFDDSNQLIYSNASSTATLLDELKAGTDIFYSDDGDFQVVRTPIQNSNWHLVVLFSLNEQQSQVRWMYIIGGLFALLGIVVTFVLFSTLSRSILNPFKEMALVMKNVENGDLSSRFTVKTNDEINQLGLALNTMISQVESHIETEYKAVINERNAQLFALHSQIQPHFLYNTLNGFIGLNRIGHKEILEKGILDLTGMLRYVLGHEAFERIENEFIYLKRYVELQKLRFDQRLTYSFDCDPQLNQVFIPKLLLQPIVENSILHGLEPLERTTHVAIQAKAENSWLCLSVTDNGAGFACDVAPLFPEHHVGLNNIQNRLALLYKEAQFTVTSHINEGTQVMIKIPMEVLDDSHRNY